MKTIRSIQWIVLGVFLFSASNLKATGMKHDRFDFDKFKAKKVAFITEAIDLSPDEAELFWPLYNELEKKKFALMNERRETEKNINGDASKLTDAEYTELSRKMASFMKKESELLIEYNEKFLKVLPPKKVVALYKAEFSFREHLLKEYRQKEDPGSGR
ncbi:MAG TPA: hypothetical protein PLK12_14165 [Prolixibacteraceae bacterium]|nr:hypothetical protein [Prolixibacteraceae bacterium]